MLKSQERRCVAFQVWSLSLVEFPFAGGSQFFALVRPSTDWVISSQIMKGFAGSPLISTHMPSKNSLTETSKLSLTTICTLGRAKLMPKINHHMYSDPSDGGNPSRSYILLKCTDFKYTSTWVLHAYIHPCVTISSHKVLLWLFPINLSIPKPNHFLTSSLWISFVDSWTS